MAETASPDNTCDERMCSTCGYSGPAGDFYGISTTECRNCKRERSKLNRVVIAHKVALADRLLELVERLAERGVLHPAELAETNEARQVVAHLTGS